MNDQTAENPFKLASRRYRCGDSSQYGWPSYRFSDIDRDRLQCSDDLWSVPCSENQKQEDRKMTRRLRAKALVVHEATAALHVVIPGVVIAGVVDIILKLQGVI